MGSTKTSKCIRHSHVLASISHPYGATTSLLLHYYFIIKVTHPLGAGLACTASAFSALARCRFAVVVLVSVSFMSTEASGGCSKVRFGAIIRSHLPSSFHSSHGDLVASGVVYANGSETVMVNGMGEIGSDWELEVGRDRRRVGGGEGGRDESGCVGVGIDDSIGMLCVVCVNWSSLEVAHMAGTAE